MATLNGSFTLTVSAPGAPPVTQSVSVGLFFQKYQHTIFTIISFPVITIKDVSTSAGKDTITTTMTGGAVGSFDPTIGQIFDPSPGTCITA